MYSTVATTDEGYYGKGIYFTSDFSYAEKYAKTNVNGEKVFVIAVTIPGNVFPVLEHPFQSDDISTRTPNPHGYYGAACHTGYQSHYTIVKRVVDQAFPVLFKKGQTKFDPLNHADELVIFQDAQALPLFLVFCDTTRDYPT